MISLSTRKTLFDKIRTSFGQDHWVRVVSVDFNHSVFAAAFPEKWKLLFLMVEGVLQAAFGAVAAVVIGLSFERQDLTLFLWLCAAWLGMTVLSITSIYIYCHSLVTIIYSVRYAASEFFLKVDPKFHSTRSSGKIIAKVTRGSDSYENMLDVFVFEILNIAGNILATSVAMFVVAGWRLALVVSVSYIAIIIVSVMTQVFSVNVMIPEWLESDDKTKEKTFESITQAQYIRSLFGVDLILDSFRKLVRNHMGVQSTMWFTSVFLGQSVRALYIGTLAILGWFAFRQVEAGELSVVVGSSLILSYLQGSNTIIRSGRSAQKLYDAYSKIKDLFTFIRGFGEQTYPVLESD
jgi:ABC-type multidrug transport system fused ATPase/permease subunit